MPSTRPMSRRSLLRGGLAVSAVGLLVPGTAAATVQDVRDRLRALEARYRAQLGVYAHNVRTGETVRYRAGRRSGTCSTFKGLLAAHILRDYDHCGRFLDRRIHYTKADLLDYSPITKKHVDTGMTVRALCAAAVRYSDNAAANLLLRHTDGPRGLTRFCRTLADPYTRFDRYEPELNDRKPGDPRDSSTPEAIGRSYGRLVVGHALAVDDREQLTTWLKGSVTSGDRFRAGLSDSWVVADKTGTGNNGEMNDIGVAWTTKGTPLVLSVMAVQEDSNEKLIAEAARELARTLAPGE